MKILTCFKKIAISAVWGLIATSFYSAQAQTLVSQGTAVGTQCDGVSVNNNKVLVGFCTTPANITAGFVNFNTTGSASVALAPPNPGDSCSAAAVNNASPPKIVGMCKDDKIRIQGVSWAGATATPVQLKFLDGIVGLNPHVSTMPAAVNIQGTIVGQSRSPGKESYPVIWDAAGNPTQLPGSILTLPPISTLNCQAMSISDNGAQTIVGICPDGTTGSDRPVIWDTPTAAIRILPLPVNATACRAVYINRPGQIAGSCEYPDSIRRAVRWAAGGAAVPIVLASINGSGSSKTRTIDMNDGGQIVGSYLTSQGVLKPFTWDPSTGVNAIGVATLGGTGSEGISLGNNGNLAVNSLTILGNEHAAGGTFGSASLTDAGVLAGGNNSKIATLSTSGCYGAGTSERSGGNKTAILITFPGC